MENTYESDSNSSDIIENYDNIISRRVTDNRKGSAHRPPSTDNLDCEEGSAQRQPSLDMNSGEGSAHRPPSVGLGGEKKVLPKGHLQKI